MGGKIGGGGMSHATGGGVEARFEAEMKEEASALPSSDSSFGAIERQNGSERQMSSSAGDVADLQDRMLLWLLLIVGGVLLYELQWVLLPFVVAALVALVCTPLVDRWSARSGRSRALCAVGVFFLVTGVASLLGFLGLPPLFDTVGRFAGDLQGTVANFVKDMVGGRDELLGQKVDPDEVARTATAAIRRWFEEPSKIATFGAVAFASAFGAFLTLVLLLYLLVSGPRLMEGLLWLAPERRRGLIEKTTTTLAPSVRRYFVGVFFVVVYASIAAYIGLGLVLGLKHAAALAVLTGVLEIIPVIGPGASAVIAGLVALIQATGIGAILAYALYAAALRLSIDQLMGPLVLGKAAQLHPVVIILGFLVGGALFGVPGVLLAAPMALAVKVSLAVARGEEPFAPARPEIAARARQQPKASA
jgi:predicted PurR-regulated permease PerM